MPALPAAGQLRQTAHDSCSDDAMRRLVRVTDYIKNNLTADDLSQTAMADRCEGARRRPG